MIGQVDAGEQIRAIWNQVEQQQRLNDKEQIRNIKMSQSKTHTHKKINHRKISVHKNTQN